MPVKRLTIQFDDVVDTEQGTTLPQSLRGDEKTLAERTVNTSTPAQQDDYEDVQADDQFDDSGPKTETIGRTPSDLVFAFINRPEFMGTILFLLSFVMFITKLEKLSDFWMPLVTGIILNSVWFGISIVRKNFSNDKG